MSEQMRAIGYICPRCGKPVYGQRSQFALAAAAAGLVCGCGESELTMEPAGDHYRVTVPCGICGGEHRAEVPAEKILQGEGVGLACPVKRQLCCYIGDIYRVESALRELEIALEKKKDQEDGAFLDSVIMYEVLYEPPGGASPAAAGPQAVPWRSTATRWTSSAPPAADASGWARPRTRTWTGCAVSIR